MIVWAIVHDLGRSGVPVALARMLEWQAATGPGDFEVHIIAGHDGPLRSRFAACATSLTAIEPEDRRSMAATVAVGAAQLWPDQPAIGRYGGAVRDRAWRRRVRHLPDPDVALVHGAGAWRFWRALLGPDARVPYVVHLHELRIGLTRSIPDEALQSLLTGARTVLAVDETSAHLARAEGAVENRLRIVPGVADDPSTPPRLPAPTATPSVIGIGPAGWRKGADRFVAVAHEVHRFRPDVEFHWIGGVPSGADAWALGAELPVTWHLAAPDPWALVSRDALLLLPSREDPLPLVVLEAAVRDVPVVAAATGGLAALLSEGRGLVVPGHDLVAMSDAVLGCVQDRDAAQHRAAMLRDHVLAHYTAEAIGPTWRAALVGSRGALSVRLRRQGVRPVGS